MSRRRGPKRGDHVGGRIKRQAADHIERSPERPGWTRVRQHADSWLEHSCGRTFYLSIDQRAHEEVCGVV